MGKVEQARAIFYEVNGNYDAFRAKVMEIGLLSGMGAQCYFSNLQRQHREGLVVEDNTKVADDFKAYLTTLEQSDLVDLLTNLIDDRDGLNTKQMRNIMKRSGVDGYK